jgi:UPF0176 protein
MVAAFYRFTTLTDFCELREPLRAICAARGLKGSVVVALEGINGALAGGGQDLEALIGEMENGTLFGGRLGQLNPKFSTAKALPFRRLKIRLKKEIVAFGDQEADPVRQVGTYVEPSDWNALMTTEDMLVIDARNAFEVAMGTFEGAVDPQIKSFGQFKDFVAQRLDPDKHRKSARFCTAGIRCEKATSHLLARGFREVYHLRGGILKYLEDVSETESRWRGECFVFDDRVALGPGLRERGTGSSAND